MGSLRSGSSTRPRRSSPDPSAGRRRTARRSGPAAWQGSGTQRVPARLRRRAQQHQRDVDHHDDDGQVDPERKTAARQARARGRDPTAGVEVLAAFDSGARLAAERVWRPLVAQGVGFDFGGPALACTSCDASSLPAGTGLAPAKPATGTQRLQDAVAALLGRRHGETRSTARGLGDVRRALLRTEWLPQVDVDGTP